MALFLQARLLESRAEYPQPSSSRQHSFQHLGAPANARTWVLIEIQPLHQFTPPGPKRPRQKSTPGPAGSKVRIGMQWGENPFGFGNPFQAGYATYMRAVNPNWARTATAIRTACRMAALHLDSPPLARRTEHPAGPSETCWSPLVGDGRAAMGSPRPNASPRPIFPPVGLGSQRQILQDRISNEINRIPDGRFDNGP